jgi:transcriptional regulator with XRE-family HTH domain
MPTVTNSDPLQEFRTELIARREALGWTTSEAAERAGITQQRWAHIERGWEIKQGVRINANPRRATVLKMARAVRWTPDEALKAAGFPPTPRRDVERLDAWKALRSYWQALSEPQRWALVYTAATMVSPRQWPEFGDTRPQPEPDTRPGDHVVRVIDLGSIDDPDEMDRVRDEPEKRRDGNG